MKTVVRAIVVYVVLFLVCVGVLIGFTPHPLEPGQLEADFVSQAVEQGLSDEEGYRLTEEAYYNSVNFLMEDVNGKWMAGSYTRSVLFDKYQCESIEMGEQAPKEGTYSVEINDGMMKYHVIYQFGEELSIDADDQARPILYIKVFGICFAAMVFFATKMQLEKKRRNNR